MKKYNVPKRKYCRDEKKMVSLRMHIKLWEKIELMANKKGWTVTDLVSLVLDQYICSEEEEK
jgi:hypothetical protein